jgi:NADPH:quinone reductase-like Zn-dependent oxidoreductase
VSPEVYPGDEVFGLAHGCLGTVVTGPAAMLVRMPPSLTYAEAASLPTVYVTANLTLKEVAGVQQGETVLVHAAAGGVGLAALQVLQGKGARVVATAGSPAKRSLLRSLGVSAVVGSRDTEFASSLAVVGGVDVVLNSLTSPGMVAGSLSVLRQGGRFVEIGKRDIWAPATIMRQVLCGKPTANKKTCCREVGNMHRPAAYIPLAAPKCSQCS